jgi:hypothetical protein
MARTLTPVDACALMTLLVKEATGQTTITNVDSSNFVSVGETVLAAGTENVLNSLSLVLGRTFMAVRPYEAKFKILNSINSGAYSNRLRKISFYSRDPKEAGQVNTNANTNLAMGFDNGTNSGSSTESMWVQNAPVPLEINVGGSSSWQDSTSIYRDALKIAFRGPSEFAEFLNGVMVEKGNDIESQKEAFNRMTFLNYVAGIYDLDVANPNGRAVNLTSEFNAYYNTTYTTAQLLTTYRKDLFEFAVARFKTDSDNLENRSARFHWSPAKTVGTDSYTLLRHTPKSKQRMILYKPFMTMAEATIMPEIFNPQYLDIKNAEFVNFWQADAGDILGNAEINVTPAIPNVSTPGAQTTGTAVNLKYFIGALYDADAIMVDYQLEDALATPVEARKRYYNMWWSFQKNAINDFTENGIIYFMAD